MSTKKLVEKYLKKAMRYRNNDRLLTLAVWQDRGFVLTPEQTEQFMSLPDMSIIERRRRELRNKYPESPEVMESRFKHYLGFKDEFVATGYSRGSVIAAYAPPKVSKSRFFLTRIFRGSK